MKYLQNVRHGHRIASLSIGMLAANFVVSLCTETFNIPLGPNTIATGTLFLAAVINLLVSKYLHLSNKID
jgi:hypothetical protein